MKRIEIQIRLKNWLLFRVRYADTPWPVDWADTTWPVVNKKVPVDRLYSPNSQEGLLKSVLSIRVRLMSIAELQAVDS